jgi:1-pyrroline-5-carboxylate dehydrogenase
MSFQLTYATMFNPPAELHQRFDAAAERQRAGLGRRYDNFIDGEDRPADRLKPLPSPIDRELIVGEFPRSEATEADAAMQAAHRAFPAWRRMPIADRLALLRKAGQIIEDRVYDISAGLSLEVGKNRTGGRLFMNLP